MQRRTASEETATDEELQDAPFLDSRPEDLWPEAQVEVILGNSSQWFVE